MPGSISLSQPPSLAPLLLLSSYASSAVPLSLLLLLCVSVPPLLLIVVAMLSYYCHRCNIRCCFSSSTLARLHRQQVEREYVCVCVCACVRERERADSGLARVPETTESPPLRRSGSTYVRTYVCQPSSEPNRTESSSRPLAVFSIWSKTTRRILSPLRGCPRVYAPSRPLLERRDVTKRHCVTDNRKDRPVAEKVGGGKEKRKEQTEK